MAYPRTTVLPSPHFRSSVRRLLGALLSVALGVILIGRARPVSAELLIAEDQPHAALWKQLYSQLPDVWKTDTHVVVKEVSSAEMAHLVAQVEGGDNREDDNSVVDGCYEPGARDGEPDTITLLSSLKGLDAELVFTHEYGHFVWDNLLTRSQRNQYRQIWKRQKASGHLVTRYAGDDVEEGFAEAFAYYLRRPATLKRRDTGSCKFLNGVLPGGAAYDTYRIAVK